MAAYNHAAVEKKWHDRWEENTVNPKTDENGKEKPKYYCLDMFPYPSGNGLHVGHWRGYVISDVWSRYKILQGYHVIHPMGWDAFGLPAENYAIKMGIHPAISTEENIKNIKEQIKQIAAVYDWDMEVNTTDPDYYKWTQWIFAKMFEAGLAYEKEFPINWCPSCKTGLANEEVVDGKCERCGTEVTKKNLRQWMLKITAYADRLLNDLKKLDWPEKVIKMQTDWIGKSYGAEVYFPVDGSDETITVYTTRPDTLYGATFMVLSPEHDLASKLATDENRDAVEAYIKASSMKSNVDRLQDKDKTGVFTGSYCINPLNKEKVPIWLSDYVLADYGTGAIMCVPAHDDRDFEFAKKFGLPIVQVIAEDPDNVGELTEAYTIANGVMINSGDWNGMRSEDLKEQAPHMIEEQGIGKATVNCATGSSHASAIGASRFRSFTARIAAMLLSLKRICRCGFRMSIHMNRQEPASRLSQQSMSGSTRPVLSAARLQSARPIQCRSGPDLHGISCVMWIITITMNWFQRKRLPSICRSTCISAELSMPCFTCCIPASIRSSSMISELSISKSRS